MEASVLVQGNVARRVRGADDLATAPAVVAAEVPGEGGVADVAIGPGGVGFPVGGQRGAGRGEGGGEGGEVRACVAEVVGAAGGGGEGIGAVGTLVGERGGGERGGGAVEAAALALRWSGRGAWTGRRHDAGADSSWELEVGGPEGGWDVEWLAWLTKLPDVKV